jgi:hypothetical protein
MTVREVEEELGISRGTAGRLRQRAEAEGLLGEIRDEMMARKLKPSPLATLGPIRVSPCRESSPSSLAKFTIRRASSLVSLLVTERR